MSAWHQGVAPSGEPERTPAATDTRGHTAGTGPSRAIVLLDLVPARWGFPAECAILCRVERIYGAIPGPGFGPEVPAHIDLDGVHLAALWGAFAPATLWAVRVREAEPGVITAEPAALPLPAALFEAGAYRVALARLPRDPSAADCAAGQDRLTEALGAATLSDADSRPGARLLDQILLTERADLLRTAPGRVPRTGEERPASRGGPFVALPAIEQHLQRLAPPQRRRMLTALRWADRAARAQGVDAFLAWWTALDALGGAANGSIDSLVDQMAMNYGLSRVEAAARFRLGRLQGLRASLVHEGLPESIPEGLVAYVAAVFSDCARGRCGLDAGRAALLLDRPDRDLNLLLREAEAGMVGGTAASPTPSPSPNPASREPQHRVAPDAPTDPP